MNRRALGVSLLAGGLARAWPAWATEARPTRERDDDLSVVRRLLQTPETRIDLATAKLVIDRLIDRAIDVNATLARLDAMEAGLRTRLPARPSARLALDALRYHLYAANPWNDYRPFHYDLTDPVGADIRNKLLPSYLSSRRGNCVSMPLLFIILGRRFGLELRAATAPNHVFVKYRDEAGRWHNLEATNGASFTRDQWLREQLPMSDESIASGTYMRPLSALETVVVMVGTLLEHYADQHRSQERIAMAGLALQHDPRNVSLILHLYGAHQQLLLPQVDRYGSLAHMPTAHRSQAMARIRVMDQLFARAWALGWRPLDTAATTPVPRQRARTDAKP